MLLPLILWYLVISLVGWLVFPLAYRLLPALADRGYALSRALGWLLWGYIFWLLASLGILRNEPGGLTLALILLVGLSAWSLYKTGMEEILTWLRSQRRLVLAVEVIFLIAFALMALIRAANPEILGTEKPMELAFINAILNSPEFPPHDPWLSGYAISYYYFGYVLVAMLAKMAGTSGGIAFNLGISLVLALSVIGVYGLVYNLLAARRKQAGATSPMVHNLSLPLLGPVFIVLVANLEGFLHVLHTRGIFWRANAAGELVSGFWTWLDIKELNLPPEQPFSWIPARFWWWWRASRVLQDYSFTRNPIEIIDEFPVFSFLLADLHPHVLATPFAFLGMALILNLVLGGAGGRLAWLKQRLSVRFLAWAGLLLLVFGLGFLITGWADLSLRSVVLGILSLVAGGFVFISVREDIQQSGLAIFTRPATATRQIGFDLYLNLPFLLLSGVVLGGLAFLNLWDFPFYLALFAAGYVVFRYLLSLEAATVSEIPENGGSYTFSTLVRDYLGIGIISGLLGFALYLPFYLGFSSQAGGVLPSLIYVTRGGHLWVMFGVLLIPIACFLAFLWNKHGSRPVLRKSFLVVAGIFLFLLLLSILLGVAIAQIPAVGDLFLSSYAAPNISGLLREALARRLVSPGGWITLLTLLSFALALLWPRSTGDGSQRRWLRPETGFALLLVLFGGLLVTGPEFFFLRDQFGNRMNTIFKFYYQAWLMWGVVAAFGSAVLVRELSFAKAWLYKISLVVLIAMGMTYTVFAFWNKTAGFSPSQGWTLDGTQYMQRQSPDELAAIQWLASAPDGVIAEAVGNQYSAYARVATLSGQPNVLGWPGHENQWRGGALEMGSRQADIQRLFCSRDWAEAEAIINQYGIRYIFIGPLERSAYTVDTCGTGLFEAKFAQNLPPVFQQGDVIIYEAP